jgi:hypothetical protein
VSLPSLTRTQRLFAGAGCVLVLVLLLGGVGVAFWSVWREQQIAASVRDLPPGWLDSTRALGRLPALGSLALERTEPGDAAPVVGDTAGLRVVPGVDHAYRALVGTAEPNAGDSAAWAALDTATALDRWVAAARRTDWRALDRTLAAADPAVAGRNLLALPLPLFNHPRRAAYGLVVRGLRRAERGDAAGARGDLGAAMALGEQMARHEPTLVGVLVGRAMMSASATGWSTLAARQPDTALATRARAVKAWATGRPTFLGANLTALPDSAVALARDTTVVLGLRAFAMEQLLRGGLVRPWQLLLGPPGTVKDALRDVERDPDPELARVAAIASETARRLNALGARGVVREMSPGGIR